MRRALEAGTNAAALWRAVDDEHGVPIDLRLVECSGEFLHWVGRPRDAAIGMLYTSMIPTGVHSRLGLYLEALEQQQVKRLVFEPVAMPGRVNAAEIRIVPCGPDLLYAQIWDVSEREHVSRGSEHARREAEAALARIEAALNASPHAFAVYRAERDESGMVRKIWMIFVNDEAARPMGRPAGSWRGVDLLTWFPEARETGLFDRLVEALDRHVTQTFTVEADPTRNWESAYQHHIVPFGPDLAVVTWRPITASSQPGSLPGMAGASRDHLTGALTRGAFASRIDSELAEGRLHDAVVVVLDLDDFGQVNDLIGQRRSDVILAEFATDLQALDSRPALLARVGPDEFALLLTGVQLEQPIDAYFSHIEMVLAHLAKAAGVPRLQASAGWVRLAGVASIADALRDCDTALRTSVAAGGARITEFTPALREELLRRSHMSEDILRGIEHEQFALAYQPILRIESGVRWGDEALVRWHHPRHGLLQPAQFIPAAEASGVIIELGSLVIRSAIADLARTPQRAHATVNVASRQLLEADVPSVIAQYLETHGVQPSRFFVEITESALLPDSDRVRSKLAELRSMGVRVALDDFGSGYSSIAYLDRIPVDVVKLDGYFLDGELTRRRRTLIASTAAMVRSLGARSLVEHIETREQLDVVREAGVDLGQGYLFGRPEFA